MIDDKSPRLPPTAIGAIASPIQRFLRTETSGGVVLLLAAVVALVIANTPAAETYAAIWQIEVGFRLANIDWVYPLKHWINDGLVTIFFFVVGLEIKREIACGELRNVHAAALPIIAALGGMIVPAGIYLALTTGPDAAGWGIVMATDIAFVVGCMALLGRRVPASLRVFILALAIVDDIGAIVVIAAGYSQGLQIVPFLGACGGVALAAAMRWLGIRTMVAYWIVGILTWLALHESGISPTITGVVFGLLTPVTPWIEPGRLDQILEWARGYEANDVEDTGHKPKGVRRRLARAAVESLSPQQRVEDALHPWSAFFVLPLFALANAGIPITLGGHVFNPITLAVVAGLVIGKPLGIFIFSWLAVATGLARKPRDVSWTMLFAVGVLAGVGFTMSLFISNLAFTGEALDAAKTGIFAASIIAGVLGMGLLYILSLRPEPRLRPARRSRPSGSASGAEREGR